MRVGGKERTSLFKCFFLTLWTASPELYYETLVDIQYDLAREKGESSSERKKQDPFLTSDKICKDDICWRGGKHEMRGVALYDFHGLNYR